jgi:hypothetical protein
VAATVGCLLIRADQLISIGDTNPLRTPAARAGQTSTCWRPADARPHSSACFLPSSALLLGGGGGGGDLTRRSNTTNASRGARPPGRPSGDGSGLPGSAVYSMIHPCTHHPPHHWLFSLIISAGRTTHQLGPPHHYPVQSASQIGWSTSAGGQFNNGLGSQSSVAREAGRTRSTVELRCGRSADRPVYFIRLPLSVRPLHVRLHRRRRRMLRQRRPRASDVAGCAGDGSGRWRRALLFQHAQLHGYVLCSGWQEQWGTRETYSGFVSEYWFAAIR